MSAQPTRIHPAQLGSPHMVPLSRLKDERRKTLGARLEADRLLVVCSHLIRHIQSTNRESIIPSMGIGLGDPIHGLAMMTKSSNDDDTFKKFIAALREAFPAHLTDGK